MDFQRTNRTLRSLEKNNTLTLEDTLGVINDVFADVKDRDYRDTHRAESPLRQAEEAVVIDNSAMTREQQMEEVLRVFRSHI